MCPGGRAPILGDRSALPHPPPPVVQERDASKALIVDDEPHILRAVRNALSADFSDVLEATTAQDAIDLAAAQRPAVVVLDLALPDRSGLWFLAGLRKWSSVPVIVLSAHHSESEKIRLLNEGADDYVTKPFSPAELLARVRAQLRRAQIGRAHVRTPVTIRSRMPSSA